MHVTGTPTLFSIIIRVHAATKKEHFRLNLNRQINRIKSFYSFLCILPGAAIFILLQLLQVKGANMLNLVVFFEFTCLREAVTS